MMKYRANFLVRFMDDDDEWIDKDKINSYINTLQKNKRHWIQFQNIKLLNAIVSKYLKNLSYLF